MADLPYRSLELPIHTFQFHATDRSFIKADYSLLFYLEDYDAWEAWSREQEHALVERNLRKTGGPANVKPVRKCLDPVYHVSGIA